MSRALEQVTNNEALSLKSYFLDSRTRHSDSVHDITAQGFPPGLDLHLN